MYTNINLIHTLMGKVKESIQKVFDDCYALYESTGGYTAVFDHVAFQQAKDNPAYKDVMYERCEACDNEMPSLNGICLICGSSIHTDAKQKLIDAVIEDLKRGFEFGDYTVLEELLGFIERDKLVQSLPEDQWSNHRTSVDYFNIQATGYNPDIDREEIEINAGENGKIMIYKTDEGFVVDVYGQEGDCIDTMPIWEDDINPNDEDDNIDKDDNGNCFYCGQKCWEGQMCDEQQAGGFNNATPE